MSEVTLVNLDPLSSPSAPSTDWKPENLWEPQLENVWNGASPQMQPMELSLEYNDNSRVEPFRGRSNNAKAIGLVYLTATQNYGDPSPELNIGIILQPESRGKGYARTVVSLVAGIAFDQGHCHRLQAILLGHVAMDCALSLFTKTYVPFALFCTFAVPYVVPRV
jgi:RimJ/RimL family protein N-acetyltransferase